MLASNDARHLFWLGETLHTIGAVETAALDNTALIQQIAVVGPAIAFPRLHRRTGGECERSGRAGPRAFPGPADRRARCDVRCGQRARALRAGVRDFVGRRRRGGRRAEGHCATCSPHLPAPVARRGRVTVLLGARIGLGVSTLAANLSVLLRAQRALPESRQVSPPQSNGAAGVAAAREVALLDLGLPPTTARCT
ncbi:MAG: hypothetical protein WDN30_16165 [Pararobbsia sp.]